VFATRRAARGLLSFVECECDTIHHVVTRGLASSESVEIVAVKRRMHGKLAEYGNNGSEPNGFLVENVRYVALKGGRKVAWEAMRDSSQRVYCVGNSLRMLMQPQTGQLH
jgi:hypothetical protein